MLDNIAVVFGIIGALVSQASIPLIALFGVSLFVSAFILLLVYDEERM